VFRETASLYRYPDLTGQTEYLYWRVVDTINTDMRQEVGFIESYDRGAKSAQRCGRYAGPASFPAGAAGLAKPWWLSKAKRSQFAELTDEEITAIEAAIRKHSVEQEES